MIQIAHISDIHFGNRFNKATWDAVADEVVRFDPNLIIVSGDLVDHPAPAHLLTARCALEELATEARRRSRANRAAELIVIPGNHDVFESGVAFGMRRLNWFERVFHARDTSQAEQALKDRFKLKRLGFDTAILGFPAGTRPQDAGFWTKSKRWLDGLLASRAATPWNDDDAFIGLLGAMEEKPRVRAASGSPVLLALLDSNPSVAGYDMATGLVDNDDLISLQRELSAAPGHHVARIAVVHHHIVPIAFAAGAARATGEPMMVLKNAGAVLKTLADHKFDLILHGHWHKPQFSRVDFGSDDLESYPIAVASAGSAAMASADDTGANAINLITIDESGRITVKCVGYGAAVAPGQGGGSITKEYHEPLAATKRRAHARARERHKIECEERQQICEVTENGDLWITHRITKLRINGDLDVYPRRPLGAYIPPHGHFVDRTLKPDRDSSAAGVKVEEAPDHPKAGGKDFRYYWISLPGGGLRRGGEHSYAIGHACANCMQMTRWEARQRAYFEALEKAKKKAEEEAEVAWLLGGHPEPKDDAAAEEIERDRQEAIADAVSRALEQFRQQQFDPPEGYDGESLAARVSFPARKLILKAKLPQSLAAVRMHVECKREDTYPVYEVDPWEDAALDRKTMVIDPLVQDEEKKSLRYDAPTRTWTLEIDRPLVGYQYALRWQVPGNGPDLKMTSNQCDMVAGKTREWQRVLLNLGGRIDVDKPEADDKKAIKQFKLLCTGLKADLGKGGGPEERLSIVLFIYDAERLALIPVLSQRSWTDRRLPQGFQIAYGGGVSGAAFQQRRIISLSLQTADDDAPEAGESLIKPIALPDPAPGRTPVVNCLALPVYHSGMENMRQPPPWAAIGVVTISSSSYGSPISGMDDAQRARLRLGAQIQMDAMVNVLQGDSDAAAST